MIIINIIERNNDKIVITIMIIINIFERNNDNIDYDNDCHNLQERMSVFVEWGAGEGFLFNQDTNVRRKL